MTERPPKCECIECNLPDPNIESLSYEPQYSGENIPINTMPKPLKRGFLGLNAHVIKPETRVNKIESAEEPLEQPICSKCQQVSCQCRAMLLKEQPNPQIAIIKQYGTKRSRVKQSTEEPFEQPSQYKPPKCALPDKNGGVLANPEPQIRTGHCPKCGQDWRTHDYSCKDNRASEPNQDLMIIEEIEGLISQVNEKINKLSSEDISRLSYKLRSQALEDIDIFQKTTLFNLRKSLE